MVILFSIVFEKQLYTSLLIFKFVQFLSNYSGSETMLFSIIVFSVVSTGAASVYTLNMLLNIISVILISSEISSLVIFNDSNISSSILILVVSELKMIDLIFLFFFLIFIFHFHLFSYLGLKSKS